MMICFRATILFCFLFSIESFSQEFKGFDRLKNKGDSVLKLKQFALGANFYEKALALPNDQKPEIFGIIYYDLACMYSLNKEKEKALDNLEKSFQIYNNKKNKNPVSASHITSDSDLDFLKDGLRFQQLLKKYYRGIDTNLLYARELNYDQLLELINYLATEDERGDIRVSNKTIYWKKKDSAFVFNRTALKLPDIKSLQSRFVSFKNCDFQLNLIWSNFSQEKETLTYKGFDFTNCNFHGKFFLFDLTFKELPSFHKSVFSQGLQLLFINSDEGRVELDSCGLHQVDIFIITKNENRHTITDNYSLDSADFRLYCSTSKSLRLMNNKFSAKNVCF
jgi:tetratricopeptide (TPR) repeat protein